MTDLLKAFTELFRILSPAQRWIMIVAMLIIGFAVYVPTHMAGQQEVMDTADLYTGIAKFIASQNECNGHN